MTTGPGAAPGPTDTTTAVRRLGTSPRRLAVFGVE